MLALRVYGRWPFVTACTSQSSETRFSTYTSSPRSSSTISKGNTGIQCHSVNGCCCTILMYSPKRFLSCKQFSFAFFFPGTVSAFPTSKNVKSMSSLTGEHLKYELISNAGIKDDIFLLAGKACDILVGYTDKIRLCITKRSKNGYSNSKQSKC